MAQTLNPIRFGNTYQAYYFWLSACRLFADSGAVERVGFEIPDVKSLDDFSVHYARPIYDERGDPIDADFFQVKFNVDHTTVITWEALMDPKFIGATSVSFLQRVRDACLKLKTEGRRCRFYLVTPRSIDAKDELARIIGRHGGEVRIDVLFDGTGTRGKMGKVRSAWRKHLALGSDEELKEVLRAVRIQCESPTLESVRLNLNNALSGAGLKPVPDEYTHHPYDDLIYKVRQTGKHTFSRAELQAICERDNLWVGKAVSKPKATYIGIKSFVRWADFLEDKTEMLLSLVPHFDGRTLRGDSTWNESVHSRLTTFLGETVRQDRPYHLHLETHSSIAFAAGYCLDPKSGTTVYPVQKTPKGFAIWEPSDSTAKGAEPLWQYEEILIGTGGNDVALAVSLSQSIRSDVEGYVTTHLSSVGRIMLYSVMPAPGAAAVRDGTHAMWLAQELSLALKEKRTPRERECVLHIFASAPNGFMFFLGRHARGFGKGQLYEYAFESNEHGAYLPSITISQVAS